MVPSEFGSHKPELADKQLFQLIPPCQTQKKQQGLLVTSWPYATSLTINLANMFSKLQALMVRDTSTTIYTVYSDTPFIQLASRTPTKQGIGMLVSTLAAAALFLTAIMQLPKLHRLLQVHSCQGRRLCTLQAIQACLQLPLPKCVY